MASDKVRDPPVLAAYAREAGDTDLLYDGMSLADLAHVVGLVEAKIIPRRDGGELLAALLQAHAVPPPDFAADPTRGDLYSNRVAYLRSSTPTVGWLGAGRPRREASTIAYRIRARSGLLELACALEEWAVAGLDLAETHVGTLFPDYTYLLPAQPTVFGHYLLTFLYPILRDLDRMRGVFRRTNSSPAGSGSVNGSRLPLDRARVAELLGFDEVVPHARDAMWQADGPIEVAGLLSSVLINLDRLAEDLQIFCTVEFGLVQLADRHTRPSVIMPQKRNPYSLAYLRGVAGESIGTLAAMAAVGKTPSGQIDNRIFVYGAVPRAIDRATAAVRVMADVLRALEVDPVRSAERASSHFIGATDLAELVMMEEGLDYETAHRIVGRAVRASSESSETTLSSKSLDAAAEAEIGCRLALENDWIAAALDPKSIVATRTGRGGAAAKEVTAMIAECRESLAAHRQWREAAASRLAESQERLLVRARELAQEDR